MPLPSSFSLSRAGESLGTDGKPSGTNRQWFREQEAPMGRITLTFDNGPEPEMTSLVLDVLRKQAVRATFFVIGKNLERPGARAVVERAREEGHWIGNHTFSHQTSLGNASTDSFFNDEVSRTFDALGDLAHPDRLFRPFCNAGRIDHQLFKKADIRKMTDAKITCVLFNSVPRDWEHADAWVNRALSELTTKPWTTIVLHDIYGYPDGVDVRSMLQLDRFMSLAKDAGHEFFQEFSPDCVPIKRGDICFDIQSLTN
jgi:peptidoglycan/xylan/chitin deacetylase (PgdA/CDA1 family)